MQESKPEAGHERGKDGDGSGNQNAQIKRIQRIDIRRQPVQQARGPRLQRFRRLRCGKTAKQFLPKSRKHGKRGFVGRHALAIPGGGARQRQKANGCRRGKDIESEGRRR